ncbi:hypothetical protein QQP08_011664, partial [Theobroma cacao]
MTVYAASPWQHHDKPSQAGTATLSYKSGII